MRAKTIIAALVMAIMLCPKTCLAQEQGDLKKEVQQIKQQLSEMDALKAKLADLEKQLGDTQKAQEDLKKAQGATAPTVNTAYGDKAKIDGRIFVGLFGTEDQGAYPNWSTDIPDAKLRFTFFPAKNITVVNRLSLSPSKAVELDYFYADFAKVLGESNILRLGQRKIDVGQETWVDNPVENMLITNSVSHVSGYGIGLATLGKLSTAANAPVYEIGFVNGPKGVTTRPSTGLPMNAKIGVPFTQNLFASASYFTTGHLGPNDNSAISVAEIANAPAGATGWQRNLWELDLRYNYGPNGIRPLVPTGKLPPFMLGATYGRFNDEATSVPNRNGSYWFAEGLLRLSPKLYAAARYSITSLGDNELAKLAKSPVAVNSYRRTAIGLGYAISDLVQWKAEYTINNTSGGASQPGLNQWSTGIAAKF